ncbi:hypothetical protein LCGC14_1116660 [marine sediment metagenome]|uniref:Uncharacterized protein n=2 Tax=marine sediment metagenome TaxID=412755 RepID=A0A0F9PN87_9ZZZZ
MAGSGKGALRVSIEDFIETYLATGFRAFINEKLDEQRDNMLEAYGNLLVALDIEDAIPVALRPGSPLPIVAGAAAALPVLLGVLVGLGMQLVSAMIAPVSNTIVLKIRKSVKDWRPDPGTLVSLQNRFPEMGEAWSEIWDELGIPEDVLEKLPQVVIPVIPETDLLTLWLRDELPEGDLNTELAARGWTEERIEKAKLVRQIIPGVGDLISMAVREAWRDDVAERFDYDQGFELLPSEPFEAQGLSMEWVKRYWRAHWVLPSITAGYQMMHRLRPGKTDNPFTIDDLQTLLRTADISPFFIDRLIEISFAPYTRVDLRRMFKAGVLNEDQVYQGYLDIGYDEEKARNLADFAILDARGKERDLTKGLIVSAYKRGTIERSGAISGLVDLRYTALDAEFIITIADAELAKKTTDAQLDRVEFLYMEGEIDEGGVYTELGPLNLPGDQVQGLIIQWEIAKRKKRTLPSRADLEGFYRNDLIDLGALQSGLSKRRIADEDITLFINQLDLEIADAAAKEAERAQVAQERIEAAVTKTVYQTEKAALDVMIADANREIADIKLVLNQARISIQIRQQLDASEELRVQRSNLKVQVAADKVRIEELKLSLVSAEEEDETTSVAITIQELKIDIATLNEDVATRTAELTLIDAQLGRMIRAKDILALQLRLDELRVLIADLKHSKAQLRLEFT